MVEIRRSKAGPKIRLADEEVTLLTILVDDLDALLAGDDEEREPGVASPSAGRGNPDPLVELTGLDVDAAQRAERPTDPVLRRLLPDAYRDDEEAAAEFRRYTDQSLRGSKRADATIVRQGLASIAVMGERVLDGAQVEAWLRFVTDARLMLASRLGIETAADIDRIEMLGDRDDPRRGAYAVYEWLVAILGGLLEAIDAA